MINWTDMGMKDRDGKESTLWIGSQGAHTPCHYDTYGINFVAQIVGRYNRNKIFIGKDDFCLCIENDGCSFRPTVRSVSYRHEYRMKNQVFMWISNQVF